MCNEVQHTKITWTRWRRLSTGSVRFYYVECWRSAQLWHLHSTSSLVTVTSDGSHEVALQAFHNTTSYIMTKSHVVNITTVHTNCCKSFHANLKPNIYLVLWSIKKYSIWELCQLPECDLKESLQTIKTTDNMSPSLLIVWETTKYCIHRVKCKYK